MKTFSSGLVSLAGNRGYLLFLYFGEGSGGEPWAIYFPSVTLSSPTHLLEWTAFISVSDSTWCLSQFWPHVAIFQGSSVLFTTENNLN